MHLVLNNEEQICLSLSFSLNILYLQLTFTCNPSLCTLDEIYAIERMSFVCGLFPFLLSCSGVFVCLPVTHGGGVMMSFVILSAQFIN